MRSKVKCSYPENLLNEILKGTEERVDFDEAVANFEENYKGMVDDGLFVPTQESVILKYYFEDNYSIRKIAKLTKAKKYLVKAILEQALTRLRHRSRLVYFIVGYKKLHLKTSLIEEYNAEMTKYQKALEDVHNKHLYLNYVLEKATKDIKSDVIMKTPLSALGFNSRVLGHLVQNGIVTLEDLLKLNGEELLNLYQIGEVARIHIINVLDSHSIEHRFEKW